VSAKLEQPSNHDDLHQFYQKGIDIHYNIQIIINNNANELHNSRAFAGQRVDPLDNAVAIAIGATANNCNVTLVDRRRRHVSTRMS
jgi:hypothetical protein